MGGCTCGERRRIHQEQLRDRQVNSELRDERLREHTYSILLLGGPKSGKSTIIKQCRMSSFKESFSKQERQMYKDQIHGQCINQLRQALSAYNDWTFLFFAFIHDVEKDGENADSLWKIPNDIQRQIFLFYECFDLFFSEIGIVSAENIKNRNHSENELNDEMVTDIKTLWNEPAIKEMYERRNITGIDDSSAHFWNKLDTLNHPDYLPDESDIILVHDNHGSQGVFYTECL